MSQTWTPVEPCDKSGRAAAALDDLRSEVHRNPPRFGAMWRAIVACERAGVGQIADELTPASWRAWALDQKIASTSMPVWVRWKWLMFADTGWTCRLEMTGIVKIQCGSTIIRWSPAREARLVDPMVGPRYYLNGLEALTALDTRVWFGLLTADLRAAGATEAALADEIDSKSAVGDGNLTPAPE